MIAVIDGRGAERGNERALRHGESRVGQKSPEYWCWAMILESALIPAEQWADFICAGLAPVEAAE